MAQEGDTMFDLQRMLRKSEIVLRHKISFEKNKASSALMWRKKSIVDEALMFLR
jgi:hypothetical protein